MARRVGPALVTVIVAAAVAVAALLVHRSQESPLAESASDVPAQSSHEPAPVVDAPDAPDGERVRRDRSGQSDRLGEADGAVPDGLTVFDDDVPAVANLDPDLRDALRRATSDAEDDGIEILVNSGWRSAEYQQQLLSDAVDEYGSEEEAARWVSTPQTSQHVSGDAVDVGGDGATEWLSEHGAGYGLCRVYDNEPWHYELRPEAADDGCPPRYADPTEDPRTQS